MDKDSEHSIFYPNLDLNVNRRVGKILSDLVNVHVLHHIVYDAALLQSMKEIRLCQRSMRWTGVIFKCLCQHLSDLAMYIHLTGNRTYVYRCCIRDVISPEI